MSIYSDLQPVVQEILGSADFKQGSTLLIQERPGAGPVDDPGPPVRSAPVTLDGAVRGVKFSFVQLGLAVASDLQITHAVVPGVVPQANDIVSVDGSEYRVRQVVALPAAGTPVAYTLIIKR